MSSKKSIILLITIFAVALFLRLVQLGHIPFGVTPDELSQGYSALSLVQTGKDEWGRLDIWFFKSFLDNKSPIQTYLMTIPVAVFGLNVWSIRLASALMGAVGCVFLALLARQLLNDKLSARYSILTGSLLAISFWHFAFSRMALEANIAMTFFFVGAYLFLIKDRWYTLFLATIFLALSMLTYHATKLFVPMMFIGLVAYKTDMSLKISKKYAFAALALLLVFYLTVFGQAASRSWELSILSYIKNPSETIKDIQYRSALNSISPSITRLFNNKYSFVVDMGFENYLSYYSPAFWFAEGGREITYSIIPGTGLMAWWVFPIVLIGLFFLIIKKQYKLLAFLVFWLICAGIPAALTKEGYRPNRAISFMGVFELIAAYGLINLYEALPYKRIFITTMLTVSLVSFAFFVDDYAFSSQIKYPTHMSRQWREAFEYLRDSKITQNYQTILIDRDGQKQSYVGFFLGVSPLSFQSSSQNWSKMLDKNPQVQYLDQLNGYQLEKYTFLKLAFPEMRQKDTLYVTDNLSTVPADAKIIKTIDSTKKQPLVEIFEFEDEKL